MIISYKYKYIETKQIFVSIIVHFQQDWGNERKEVGIVKIVVDGAGFKELNQEYLATSPDEIPTGLAGNYDLKKKI